MLLDGINMEDGAIRGEEKITRAIWKSLSVRLYLDTLINVTILTAASYFKYTQQLVPNVLCCSAVLTSTALLLSYDGHIFKTKSDKILRILLQTVTRNAELRHSSGGTHNQSAGEMKDVKLRKTYERLKMALPIGWMYFVVSTVSTCGTVLYGLASIGTEQGMMWSSPITAFMQTLVLSTSFCVINAIFIKWYLVLAVQFICLRKAD
jgi:hypothetical protein